MKERYKIFEDGIHIGFFNVEYRKGEGRFLTADIFKESQSFILLPDVNGHVNEERLKLWLEERIIPPTRVNIQDNLKAMGLTEYDELEILRYTSGCRVNDNCRIDFSKKEKEI